MFPRRSDRPKQPPALQLRQVEVLGSHMAYREAGSGPPIVFIHGGIGSSLIWRGQISHMARHARCIAVDLIGMGHSARLLPTSPSTYRTEVQLSYLEAFLGVLGITQQVVLVLHGWGSMAGFAFAHRQPHRVRAIAHIESITHPLKWDDLTPRLHEVLSRARSENGETFVLDTDEYFELAIRRETVTPMGRSTVDAYRETLGDAAPLRRALLSGLTEIPIDGTPANAQKIVEGYWQWFRSAKFPKLMIVGEPGYLMTGSYLETAASVESQTIVRVSGAHLLQEDSPDGVALLLEQWHRNL